RHSVLERDGIDKWFERRAWLAAAADSAVVGRGGEVGAPDHCEDIGRVGLHRSERRLQISASKLSQAIAHGGFCGVLEFWHEGGIDLPVRRVVAAVDVAELLPEKFLGIAVARLGYGRQRTEADLLRARGLLRV